MAWKSFFALHLEHTLPIEWLAGFFFRDCSTRSLEVKIGMHTSFSSPKTWKFKTPPFSGCERRLRGGIVLPSGKQFAIRATAGKIQGVLPAARGCGKDPSKSFNVSFIKKTKAFPKSATALKACQSSCA